MTDFRFDRYVQVIVVHWNYIPADVLALFGSTPEKLPRWDPMFHAPGLE